ncbi:MAG: hypothetical protein NTW08_09740 [Gammaproteobacteria bacterium]|nr:hypothetical protein [Gammaproteobacteria bacterium]
MRNIGYKIHDPDRVFGHPIEVKPALFNTYFPHGLSRSQIILYDAVIFKINFLIYDLMHYDRPEETMSEQDILQLKAQWKQMQAKTARLFVKQLSQMPLIDFNQSAHNHSYMAVTH